MSNEMNTTKMFITTETCGNRFRFAMCYTARIRHFIQSIDTRRPDQNKWLRDQMFFSFLYTHLRHLILKKRENELLSMMKIDISPVVFILITTKSTAALFVWDLSRWLVMIEKKKYGTNKRSIIWNYLLPVGFCHNEYGVLFAPPTLRSSSRHFFRVTIDTKSQDKQ